MKFPIGAIITSIIAVLAALGGFGLWFNDYHGAFATKDEVAKLASKQDVNMNNLDGRISNVETKVLIYTLIGIDKLDPVSKGRYKRANARLVNLEAERDKAVRPSSN